MGNTAVGHRIRGEKATAHMRPQNPGETQHGTRQAPEHPKIMATVPPGIQLIPPNPPQPSQPTRAPRVNSPRIASVRVAQPGA